MAKKKIQTGAVTLPKPLLDKIDLFCKTEYADEFGYNSRPDVIVHAMRDFFAKQKDVFEEIRPRINLLRMSEDKIYLYDETLNKDVTMLVRRIKDEPILICEVDNDPNCPHRDFCLKNQNCWQFLESHHLKIQRVRK